MCKVTEKIEINGRELKLETGELAKQAGGSVVVSYGGTVVLAACCVLENKEDPGFFPLTVDYRERTYAAGKIPGGFFKREGRPQEKEIITSRLIDRPIRPLFPDGYFDEVQIILTVLSSDGENDSDIPAMIGGSCAAALSIAPVESPVGAVRIGKIKENYIINPTFKELEKSEFDLVIAGTDKAITMLEGEARESSEDDILKGIEIAEQEIKKIVELQKKVVDLVKPRKKVPPPVEVDESLAAKVTEHAEPKIIEVFRKALSKQERSESLKNIAEEEVNEFALDESGELNEEISKQVSKIIKGLEKTLLRRLVTEEGVRVDGRRPEELRPITCRVGVLPRTHGSAVFTKGETQSLAVATLGTGADQQIMDELAGEYKKNFMLHYNFPPFAVGEVRFLRGPGRREIGHGLLAEKALVPVMAEREQFPYTVRLVSDILESNGSSSMATVCAGSMALMDAGIPVKAAVAGVGMGIIENTILTDMLGDEDHAGDMDFKVAGTRTGITAIQMDIKVSGISQDVLRRALAQAKEARIKTIEELEKAISAPRKKLSEFAPKLTSININPDKIGALIGPGGKNINKIQDETGANIDIEEDGTVLISAKSGESLEQAEKLVHDYTDEIEPGKIYEGEAVKVTDFGVFVRVLPGKDGLVHISELAPYHVKKVEDVVKEGDRVKVKCIGVDDRGRVKLSRVEALSDEEKRKEKEEHSKE